MLTIFERPDAVYFSSIRMCIYIYIYPHLFFLLPSFLRAQAYDATRGPTSPEAMATDLANAFLSFVEIGESLASSAYKQDRNVAAELSPRDLSFRRLGAHLRATVPENGGDEWPGTEFYDPETGLMGETAACDTNSNDVFKSCVYKTPKPTPP